MSEILPEKGGRTRRPRTKTRRRQLPGADDLPAPAFLTAADGSLRAWNRAFMALLEIPGSISHPHLVRQRLLEGALGGLDRLYAAAEEGRQLRIRMRTINGEPLDLLAAPGLQGQGRELLVVLVDAAEWNRGEGLLRLELHRLERLLETTEPTGRLATESWREVAQALLEQLPGPALVLDRDLRVLLPLQEEEGPPVLCTAHLFGTPGACPACLGRRAQESGRTESMELDEGTLFARPLPGGMVVEWLERS